MELKAETDEKDCEIESEPEEDDSPAENDENLTGDEGLEGNLGWADSMAKILMSNKPKKKKCLVLSRAKKLQQIKKEEKTYDFEIEGESKEEKLIKREINENLASIKKESKPKILFRVKPTVKDREREKVLKKIATKGVVQLFNAVRIEQKDLKAKLESAGPLDHKKDAVLNNINKRKFLDILMGGERAKSQIVDNLVKKEDNSFEDETSCKGNKSEWSVLRDDFMTNKKLKHWDQDDDSESEKNNTSGNEMDDVTSDNE